MNEYKFLIDGPVYNEVVYGWQNIVGGAIDIVRIVITGICIIALTILSIRFFSHTPTVQSENKKVLPDYIIGIVILLGAANIIPFLIEFIGAVLSKI